MENINLYLNNLERCARGHLKEKYNIDKVHFSPFQLINSYLIYQSIDESKTKKNSLIYIPDTKDKSKFYIPVIIILALYNFYDNYIVDETDFEIGEIVQKDGDRFKIDEIKNNSITITKEDKSKSKIFIPKSKLKNEYIITTAKLNNNKAKIKFNDYKRFFTNNIIGLDNSKGLPSKFKYKSIIITDKSIEKQLKKYKVDKHHIHKSFPFKYITKTGKESDNIPIDPMIYIVNDYQTARKYILDKGIFIRNVIFIGASKYKNDLLNISNDLNNKRIEKCLLIGDNDIKTNALPDLYKWKWTLLELNYFKYIESKEICKLEIKNDEFSELLNEFNETIIQIEKENGLNLKELYKFIRRTFPIVVSSSECRLIKQLDKLLIYFEKEALDIVETAFYDIDEYDYEDSWKNILEKFTNLINWKKKHFLKYEQLMNFKKIDFLVVPEDYLGIWNKERRNYLIRKVISFKDFKNLEITNKVIVFLGFYGYEHLKSIIYNPNKINILLYPQEKEWFINCANKLERETYNELKNLDRKKISEISFKEIEKVEDISELIKRLSEKYENDEINPDHSINDSTNISYKLTFENDIDIPPLDANKAVLLEINHKEREEKIENLKVGDVIRVYDNTTKEEVYKIAKKADKSGTFNNIEYFSKLWKTELSKYSKSFNSLETFLMHLNDKGLSISSESTLKNWINSKSSVKFPHKTKDLLVLKKTINSNMLNYKFNDIIKSRQAYNGIMIALGRDLSDEISAYIKKKQKGKILKEYTDEQIQKFVDQNAQKRIVKTIKAIDYE